ncbi:MAG: M48 family metalloprotease [Cyanothece sp. SIO2G6]|nr:M48 family metalloprotease [Cyanothece sp. SIO2G6]
MVNPLLTTIKQSRRRLLYGIVATAVALGLIVGTANPAPAQSWLDLILRGAQIIQLSTMSDRQEMRLGAQINDQIIGSGEGQFQLYRDDRIQDYVERIGDRLVPYSQRSDLDYVFQVVQDNAVNAFATMGGYVYVTTGLMKTADNEAQLASVVGHEIGHIVGRHAVKQLRQAAIAQGAMTAAGVEDSVLVNIAVELGISRPHSRDDEREADMLGLDNITQAGYAPSAMPAFMAKLMSASSPPTFLSTHPSVSSRVEDLSAQIDPATANQGDGLDAATYQATVASLP